MSLFDTDLERDWFESYDPEAYDECGYRLADPIEAGREERSDDGGAAATDGRES